MIEQSLVKQEIERASEIYPLLLAKIGEIQKELDDLGKDPNRNGAEIYIRAQRVARFSADLLALDAEINTLKYVLGEDDKTILPSQRYDIKDDGKEPSECNTSGSTTG
jgi:hypothetical protein